MATELSWNNNTFSNGGDVIGVQNVQRSSDLGRWLASEASKSKAPAFHESEFSNHQVTQLFEEQAFQLCLANLSETLVWTGPPGAGKTMTMQALLVMIDGLNAKSRAGTLAVNFSVVIRTASMFFDYQTPDQHTPDKVLLLLLLQLLDLEADWPSDIQELHQKFTNSSLTLENITATIITIVKRRNYRTCFFLDALDECRDDKCLKTILQCIREIQKQARIGVVFTTRRGSKPESQISDVFFYPEKEVSAKELKRLAVAGNLEGPSAFRSGTRRLHFHEFKADDLDVRDCIDRCSERFQKIAPELLPDIKRVVSSTHRGIFLLVELNLNYLYACTTADEITRGLETIRNTARNTSGNDTDYAKELKEAFNRNIKRIVQQKPFQHGRKAILVLSAIRDSFRPLSKEEVLSTVAFQEGPVTFDKFMEWNELQSMCQGLVEVDESGIVQFIHSSLGEHLKSSDGLGLIPDNNDRLGLICVAYMKISYDKEGGVRCTDKELLATRARNYPLLHYATRHWYKHLTIMHERMSADKPQRHVLLANEYALEFLQDDGKVDAAFQMTLVDDPIGRSALQQRYLRRAGDEEIHFAFFVHGKDFKHQVIDPFESSGKTGLHLAIVYGLSLFIGPLMESCTSVEKKDALDCTPLFLAVEKGDEPIVRALLERGATPNCVTKFGFTPLHRAITMRAIGEGKRSQDYFKIAKMLLEYRADVNAQSSGADSGNFFFIYVRTLPDGQAVALPAAYTTVVGRTPLHCAISQRDQQLIKLFREQPGCQLNTRDSIGFTPLLTAAKKGLVDVVKNLLASWQVGNHLDRVECERDPAYHGYNMMHLGCVYRERGAQLVEFLIEQYPDLLRVPTPTGETPLQLAKEYCAPQKIQDALSTALQSTAENASGETTARPIDENLCQNLQATALY